MVVLSLTASSIFQMKTSINGSAKERKEKKRKETIGGLLFLLLEFLEHWFCQCAYHILW